MADHESKNRVKLSTLPSWLNDQIERWLQKKPTGSATITIEFNANQGGIGNVTRQFSIKETI